MAVGEQSNSGMHVHHEVKDIISSEEQISSLLSIFAIYQEPLFALCAPYRQENTYCEKIYSPGIERISQFNHRQGFNFTSRGTLEFRMKESLDNTGEILRWIKLTQKVVEDVAFKIKGEVSDFKEEVSTTLNLLEQEKMRQLRKSNSLDALDQFLSAKEYSKILLSVQNKA